MSRKETFRLTGPIALAVAFFAAPTAWLLLQQGEGTLVYLACPASGPPLGIVIGLAAVGACSATSGLAWRIARTTEPPARRFLAQVATGAAAIFALAALVMTAAIWLVPSCVR
jgi:uncharacterized membrane protein